MIRPRVFSIRDRLAALVIVVAVPFLLFAAGIVWHLADREQEARRGALMYASRAVLSAVDAQLGRYVAVGQSLAASLSVTTYEPAKFCEDAVYALAGLPGAWAMLGNQQRQQVANTRAPTCLQDTRKTAASPEMLAVLSRMAGTKQVEISGVHVSPMGGIPVIAVGIPIPTAGEPRYFVVILVDTTVFFELLNTQRMPDGWAAGIIDRSGNFVTRSRDHEQWVTRPAPDSWRAATSREGFFELPTVDGDLVEGANVISVLSGWALGVSVQKKLFEAPMRRTMLAAAVTSGAATLLSILLAIWAARKITKPIEALERGAEILKRGEAVRFPPTGVPELDHAMNAFEGASEVLLSHELALSESEARLKTIVDGALDGIVSSDQNGIIQSANPAACRLYGYEPHEMIGQSISMLMPESYRGKLMRYLEDSSTAGDGEAVRQTRETDALRKDGSIFPIELAVTEAAQHGSRVFIATIRDISERRQAEQHQQLLLRELSHRVKNTLGVVKAIARLTASTTKDQNAFNEAFSDRIMALAISHEELLTANWTGADFGSLIWSHLAPFVGENSTRLEVNGPAVVVPPEKVTDLGMVMHELGTNAVKYGAWSNNTGIVKVNWHVFNKGPGRVLTINWTEQGGPPATVSTHKGFGTKMINVAVEVIDRRFEPTGLVFEFALALPPPAGEQPLPMAASA